MNKMTSWAVGAVAATFMVASAFAQERASKEEARALADKAAAHVSKVGAEQAFKDFNDKSSTTWKNKDLYVFAYNMKGDCVAHGANEQLVGKNQVQLKDSTGKPIIQEMLTVAQKGGGTVDYSWAHPETKQVEAKTTFVVKTPNYDGFVGVGAYK